eukprot:TRINITY_DN3413_c0_g1_i3.p1 TRINITY_DN3413_c0_g1~~TRINITY_DN3413_c0_g1_i3.p1  ORF type:complete len:664 (-),score=249.11 TRINITY_DN3413_c0_g1_i3:239-2230(-)
MGREKKKGTSGAAVSFITRNAALKKLQLSLGEFRRLCILKGIFPRDPKKTLRGKNKTYYFTKDILFLSHDPLLQKFREYRILKKKVKRAQAKNDPDAVQRLREHGPKYTLDHIVRERYPRFVDALQDVDDALCMLHAFARLPNSTKVKGTRAHNCDRLCREFDAYVARSHSLRKVFVSIKGVYFQAQVFGQTITWLTPHRFHPQIPKDVDLKVMTHFSEFYESMMKFVNNKLYNSIGLKYPPQLDADRESTLGGGLDALLLQFDKAGAAGALSADPDAGADSSDAQATQPRRPNASEAASARRIRTLDSQQLLLLDKRADADLPAAAAPADDDDEAAAGPDDAFTEQQRQAADSYSTLLRGCKIFLAREVPQQALSFVIQSFGGEVSLEGPAAAFAENDPGITHQVVDRNSQAHQYLSRAYVQPQWVFDSVNELLRLPEQQYAPGVELPPHLSPFVDDAQEGYTPLRREQIERIRQGLPEVVQQAILQTELGAAHGETTADADDDDDEENDDSDDEPAALDSMTAAAAGDGAPADGDDDAESENGDDEPPAPSSDDDNDAVDELEAQYQAELKAEMRGGSYGTPVSAKGRSMARSAEKAKEDERAQRDDSHLAKIMMTKKNKRLYYRMQHGIKQKQKKNDQLMKKRREHAEQRPQSAAKKQKQ